MEHYWIVASQSDRFVDNERLNDEQGGSGALGEYCDDPAERAWSFPKLSSDDESSVYRLEEKGDAAQASRTGSSAGHVTTS